MEPWETFDSVRRRVSTDDVSTLVAQLDESLVQKCLDLSNTPMQARHIRGGAAKLLAGQVRRGTLDRAFGIAATIVAPMIVRSQELLGERAEDPTSDDLREILSTLTDEFSDEAATFLLAVVAVSDLPAAAAAAQVLAERVPAEAKNDRPGHTEPPTVAADEEEHARALFTTLDEALIRSVVAACNDTIGAFTRDEVRALVDEVVKLNSGRHASWFHVGFLEALDDGWEPDHPDAGMNDARRTWLVFGLLSGHTRRRDWAAVRDRTERDWEIVQDIVGDPSKGSSVTRPLVLSLLEDQPRRAADVLAVRRPAGTFAGFDECVRSAHERARGLLNEQRVPEAKALWTSLGMYPSEVLEQLGIDVTRRLVTCSRAADDFVTAARLLDELDPTELLANERAVLHTERGLVAAEIQHLRHVSLGSPEHEEHLAARLERGRHHFEAALEVDPYEWRANLCLGVLEHHEKSATAGSRLQLALSGMRDDPLLAGSDLPDEIRFHAALERLRTLESGADGPAFGEMKAACSRQWRPSTEDVVNAGDLFLTFSSRHTCDWLKLAHELLRSPAPLAPLALELVKQGDAAVVDVIRSMARSRKVPSLQRLQMLTGVLDDVRGLSVDDEEAILDELEDLLQAVDDPDTDRAYAAWLSTATARELTGAIEARLRQVDVRRRLGEVELARTALEEVIHRAAADPDGAYTPSSLLEIYRELHPDEESLLRLEALATPRPTSATATTRRVRLVFVGGDERQAADRDEVDRRLTERHDGKVTVHWVFPGWGSNWLRHAETAEAHFERADALVLMPFVRTNLGRRLRRTCGESGLPWIACTGRGREAMLRSIEEAIAVARR